MVDQSPLNQKKWHHHLLLSFLAVDSEVALVVIGEVVSEVEVVDFEVDSVVEIEEVDSVVVEALVGIEVDLVVVIEAEDLEVEVTGVDLAEEVDSEVVTAVDMVVVEVALARVKSAYKIVDMVEEEVEVWAGVVDEVDSRVVAVVVVTGKFWMRKTILI